MKINKIIIENFACYKDHYEVSFDTSGKITLISGMSGAGKTVLVSFFNWVLYDNFILDEKNKNLPKYNTHILKGKPDGATFDVFGQIDFSHNGVEYRLKRFETYSVYDEEATLETKGVKLQYQKDNGSWDEYTLNVAKKINEILPKALSKYFFFKGEQDLKLDRESNSDLTNAIDTMFDLSKYKKALAHLGENKYTANTVLKKYNSYLNSNKNRDIKYSSTELFSKLCVAKGEEDKFTEAVERSTKRCNKLKEEIDNLIKIIGQSQNSDIFEKTLNLNKKSIVSFENQIINSKKRISFLLYSGAPYQLLIDKAKITRDLLAKNAKEEKSFIGLRKDLLKDILRKNDECICGKKIDEDAIKHINQLIDSMPPKSYKYTFNQFVENASVLFKENEKIYDEIEKEIGTITRSYIDISELEEQNKKIIADLEKFKETKEKASQLQALENEHRKALSFKSQNEVERKKWHNIVDRLDYQYEEALKIERVSDVIKHKIDLLTQASNKIKELYLVKRTETIDILEKSIKEVYSNISTRDHGDMIKIQKEKFLKEDFSLRSGYKTGGQEVIDVFSYVVGMILALQKMNLNDEGKEFPMIIDAPFSKTDYQQLSYIVDVIPKIVPQAIFLTFDIDKIKLHSNMDAFGKVLIITSLDDSQTISKIEEGSL